MWNILRNLLNTELKVHNGVGRGQNVGVRVVCPGGRVAQWDMQLTTTAQITREERATLAGSGRDPDAKFEVWFLLHTYHFHTIVKSKHCKSNHRKLGTVCISYCRLMTQLLKSFN